MKKHLKKIIVVLCCLILLSCTFCFSVSAESTSKYQEDHVVFNSDQVDIYKFIFSYYEAYDFSVIDSNVFEDMVASNHKKITGTASGDHDHEFISYDVNVLQFQGDYVVVSYAFEEQPLFISSPSDSDLLLSKNVIIRSGMLDFYTSDNLLLDKFRFSLRDYNRSTGEIGQLVAYSSTFPVFVDSDELWEGVLNYYIEIASNIRFTFTSNVWFDLVLCIDFVGLNLYEKSQTHVSFDVGNSYFDLMRYTGDAGAVYPSPYYPELNTPMYSNPYNSHFNELLGIENELLSSHAELSYEFFNLFDFIIILFVLDCTFFLFLLSAQIKRERKYQRKRKISLGIRTLRVHYALFGHCLRSKHLQALGLYAHIEHNRNVVA